MFGIRCLVKRSYINSGPPLSSFMRKDAIVRKNAIPGVKKIILVSSAKGGVGKSTVAVNLALSLFKISGTNVGLLDADVFGPSIPKMMNLRGEPEIDEKTGFMIPKINYGISVMSMGFLVKEQASIVWRGLMVMKSIQQLLFQVKWDNLDYLVIDMPPGTGDTQLSVSQLVPVTSAVIVSTPQEIALQDARRGITMFRTVNIPIAGIIENMSVFSCPCCKTTTHIFGKQGAEKLAKETDCELLGCIPIVPELCSASDQGKPVVVTDSTGELSKTYLNIAQKLYTRTS